MTLLPRPIRPTEHERDTLRAAVLDGDDAARAWARVRDGFDPDTVTPAEYELLPRLAARLDALDPGSPDLPRLRGYRRHTWTTNQVALAAAAEVAATLDGAGIPSLGFGTIALVATYHDDPAMRRVGPPQLLVPYDRLAAAAGVLAAAGEAVGPFDPPGPVATRHRVGVHRDRLAIVVARVPAPALAWPGAAGGAASFWAAPREATVAGATRLVTAAEPALVIECVDALAGHGPVRLVALAEVHALARRPDLDWAAVVACAREQHATGLVADALALAAEILGPVAPAPVLADLAATPTRARDRLVHRLHEAPAFTVPLLGGAPDSVGRAIAATAPLPPVRSVPAALGLLAAHWGARHLRTR